MIQICIKSFWRNIFTPIIQLHRKEKKLKKEILRKEQIQLYSLLYTRIRLRRKWLRMAENKRWANAIKQHTQNNFQMNTQKRCPLHYRGLECKSRKSRNTWRQIPRQIWPWNMEWTRAKANRVLSREHTGHSKHPFPTTQETMLHMDITTRLISKSDWLCSSQAKKKKFYIVNKNKTWSWLWLIAPYCRIQA